MHICKGYFVGTGEIVRLSYCVRNNYVPRTHDVIITSFLRQNDVVTSFWCDNDVIITSCVRWWRIWVNKSHESTTTDNKTTTKQNTASPCVYFVMDISLAVTDVSSSIWSWWYWNYGFGPIFIKKPPNYLARNQFGGPWMKKETVISLKDDFRP